MEGVLAKASALYKKILKIKVDDEHSLLKLADIAAQIKSRRASVLVSVLATCGQDKLIPSIVWPNLHPLLETEGGRFARLAAGVYLATRGRDKVGFTIVTRDDDGAPEYIGGLRGAVERNAMRLYLAIDTYLDALDESVAQRRDRSLRTWLDAIARYPRQLAEADRSAYLEAKRERL